MSSFERIQKGYNDAVQKISDGVSAMLTSPQTKFDQQRPKSNIFNYLESIGNEELFFYIIVVVFAVFISNSIGLEFTMVAGLVIGLVIVYYLREREISLGDNFEMEHETKLEHDIFNNTNNMHMDASLIDLLYSIKEYKQYNPDVYIRLSKNIDNLLRIEKDLENGAERPAQLFDVAHICQKKALNALHSMIHSIPYSKNSDEKFTEALEEFNKLFARHIANMKKMVIKLQNDHPMNVDSRPDFHATDVDGNDTHYNGHYEFFA
jgi:hypothetical protein